MKKYLVLENGNVYEGEAFGAGGSVISEIVFTTSMTAYIETLTDASYKGQSVVQTFPLIGNYGIITSDMEGETVSVSGYIVREACSFPSNFRCETDIDTFLKKQGIPGIKGIDTRALTKVLREHGTMNGAICDSPDEFTPEAIRAYRIVNPVEDVTVKEIVDYKPETEVKFKVVMFDYGTKKNIVRSLLKRGCEVFLVPADTSAAKVREIDPDGLFLSNGPGDPKMVTYAIETIRQLLGKKPMFGICLGHQLLALALGGDTYKLKFGHRGVNHPVKDFSHDRVYITSQNHGYVIDESTVAAMDVTVTHRAVNDGTIEGMRHNRLPAFSVQYHPEAAPGPDDNVYLFQQFNDLMKGGC